MKYSHVLSYVASQLWAIDPSKLQELLAVLAFRAAGHTFTAEEIQARVGVGPGSRGVSSNGSVAIVPVRGVIAHRMGAMDDSSGGTSCERIGAMLRFRPEIIRAWVQGQPVADRSVTLPGSRG